MKLPSGMFFLVLVISGYVVSGGNHGPSKNLYNFLTLLSGYFANPDQVSTDQQGNGLDYHENVTSFWRPVYVKDLHGKITFYLEVTVNHEVTKIARVSSMSRFLGYWDAMTTSPADVHRQDYRHLEYEPLPDHPDCESLFYSVDVDVYVGTIPICQGDKDGEPARISVTLTCHSVSLNFCGTSSKLPYIQFKDDSYTLPKYITRGAHYESTCYYG